jgi:hypothetical protein
MTNSNSNSNANASQQEDSTTAAAAMKIEKDEQAPNEKTKNANTNNADVSGITTSVVAAAVAPTAPASPSSKRLSPQKKLQSDADEKAELERRIFKYLNLFENVEALKDRDENHNHTQTRCLVSQSPKQSIEGASQAEVPEVPCAQLPSRYEGSTGTNLSQGKGDHLI